MKYSTATEILSVEPNQLIVKSRPSSREETVLTLIFVAAAIGGFAILPGYVSPWAFSFGVYFAARWLMNWRRQRMTFDWSARVLRLKWPVKGIGCEIAFDDLEAVEVTPDEDRAMAGRIDLAIARPAPMRLGVAMRPVYEEERLLGEASYMGEHVGVPVRDVRPAEPRMEVPGTPTTVCTGFSAGMGWGDLFAYRAVDRGPGLMTFEARRPAWSYFGCNATEIVPVAIVLSAALIGGVASGFLPTRVLAALGVLVVPIGWAVVHSIMWGKCPPPIVFDRARGQLRWQLLTETRFGGVLAMGLVTAVQIASATVQVDSGTFQAYEINVVLSDPTWDRLTVASHQEEAIIRNDAHRLAEFLGVPLLDHVPA